jgi:hypothetical protein
MGAEDKVGAVHLNARLCGVSPPVTRRLVITEQASLAQLHAALQAAFDWSNEHLYVFQIRGWQFGDPARAIELALAGGGVDMPLAAFAFEVNEIFRGRGISSGGVGNPAPPAIRRTPGRSRRPLSAPAGGSQDHPRIHRGSSEGRQEARHHQTLRGDHRPRAHCRQCRFSFI